MYDVVRTFKPENIDELLSLLEMYPDSVILSGGTDVMIRLKNRKLKEATLIYIREIPELNGITIKDDGEIVIGSAVCFDDVYKNEVIKEHIPILSEACNTVGSPQIRNIGTIGGNICNGAVSADSVPSLLALDAILEVRNKKGVKNIPITEFHTGPGKTVLEHGDVLISIRITKASYDGYRGKYIKFGQRNSMEISTLGCASTVKVNDGRIESLRLAFGVAAPVPTRCRKLEESVKGMKLDDAFYSYIEDNVLSELSPRDSWRSSKELRVQLIKTLSVRSIRQVLEK